MQLRTSNTPQHRAVVVYSTAADSGTHEHATRMQIGQRLAALKGCDFAGEYDASGHYERPLYFVPSETLIGVHEAQALGILCEHDLFGGVVPHGFVSTKSISHPLIEGYTHAPEGWSDAFATDISACVLRGYSAFAIADARRAGRRLLERGDVRVKRSREIGGRGQTVVHDVDELEHALATLDPDEMRLYGVVLEQNLVEVTTYSVGRVVVGDLVATYFGSQKLATNHEGDAVYGGSDLTVVRGEFDALLRLRLPDDAALAVEHARCYDAAATRHFRGLVASRRNYDVAIGVNDASDRCHCGVLEQSWRVGGASGAEIAALECLRNDASAVAVHAECFEIYEDAVPPPDATVYFDGVDPKVGHLLKYCVVTPYVDT